MAPAGQSDHIADTISYSAIARTVLEVGTSTRCKLLEHMAQRMAATVLERFPVTDVRLQLFKTPPPTNMMMAAAGVEIYRQATPPPENSERPASPTTTTR